MEVNFDLAKLLLLRLFVATKERKTSLFLVIIVVSFPHVRLTFLHMCLCVFFFSFCFCLSQIYVLNIIRNKGTISHDTVPRWMWVYSCRMQCALHISVFCVFLFEKKHWSPAKYMKMIRVLLPFFAVWLHSIPLCDGVSWANVSLFICRVLYYIFYSVFFKCYACIAHIQ